MPTNLLGIMSVDGFSFIPYLCWFKMLNIYTLYCIFCFIYNHSQNSLRCSPDLLFLRLILLYAMWFLVWFALFLFWCSLAKELVICFLWYCDSVSWSSMSCGIGSHPSLTHLCCWFQFILLYLDFSEMLSFSKINVKLISIVSKLIVDI